MAEFILEARDLHFKYPDGTRALGELSLSIEKGKKVVILGPNGAGKTTLFLHFNGILRPARGQVRFAGRDVRYDHASLMDLRKKVGIVFQDPDTQLFSASVSQEISFGPMNMGLSKEQVLQRVYRAMAETGITDLKDRPTHFLSYGQKKRVSIADILAMDPEVIIFDEPTAYLDPRLKGQIVELLDRLNRDGKTVLLSTHDVDLAYSWADYIFVVKGGAVAGKGTPERIFLDDELLRATNLERPWLIEVYNELREKGWLPGNAPVPRNKKELLACIPEYRLFKQSQRLSIL
ncbi:MAG: energy-coupling factor ABC transporter ATP-binding protein [Bacillota bacterium]